MSAATLWNLKWRRRSHVPVNSTRIILTPHYVTSCCDGHVHVHMRMRLQLLRPVANAARARALLWPFYCRYPVRCGGAMCSLHKGNHRDDSSENAFGRSSGATRLHSLVQSCTLYSTLYTMNAHLWLFADAECEHCACVCKVNCVVLYTTNGQAKWYSYDPVSFGHQQHTTVVYVNAVLSCVVLCASVRYAQKSIKVLPLDWPLDCRR